MPQLFHPRHGRRRLPVLAVVIVSLAASLVVHQHACNQADENAEAAFHAAGADLASQMNRTLSAYAAQLEVARGFVAANGGVSRESWRTFVTESGIRGRNPGIFGFAYIEHVTQDELAAYVEHRRAEGFGDLMVRPVPNADALNASGPHYVIRYHEPETVNRDAIGLDLATRIVNKDVYDRAAHTGETQLSDGIPLIQENGTTLGLVMAAPVHGPPPSGDDALHVFGRTLEGWIAMPISLSRLINSIGLYHAGPIAIQIWEDQDHASPLYVSDSWDSEHTHQLRDKLRVAFGGKDLYLVTAPSDATAFGADHTMAHLMLACGVCLSAVLGMFVDTQLKKRDAATNTLDAATRNAQIGIWEWDLIRDTFEFSDSYFDMLGYRPGEIDITNESWDVMCHPDDLQGERDALEAHLSGRSPRYMHEHRIRNKNGEWLWIRDIGEVVERTADGKPKRMLGVHIDIQSLRDAQANAESAKKAQAEFFANMSHEIRTPLTAILGYLDLMDTQDAAQRLEASTTVRKNARVLLAIVDDLLDVSKVQASRMRIESIAFDPWQLTQDVVTLLRPRAEEKGIEISAHVTGSIPQQVTSDPTRLRQILFNLIGNAIKFTQRGSIEITLACNAKTNQLSAAVTDTGIGMTAEQLAGLRRFEGFFQADASTTRRFGGTGLGLRLVNALTDLLGGALTIRSDFGVGSTFTATIDCGDLGGQAWLSDDDLRWQSEPQPHKPKDRASGQQPGSGQLTGRTILLVEDGPDNQRLIGHHLSRAGADVHIEENGKTGIAWVRSRKGDQGPALILMDMQMPVMDGVSATAELRRQGCNVPIIVLTANAGAEDRDRCMSAGADQVMTKPIDFRRLIDACATWSQIEPDQSQAA